MTNDHKLQLSGLAAEPGRPRRHWCAAIARGLWWGQLMPLTAFTGIWGWDRRRRFSSGTSGNSGPSPGASRFAPGGRCGWKNRVGQRCRAVCKQCGQRLACGGRPHFPARCRLALVGRDILELLPEAERRGDRGKWCERFWSHGRCAIQRRIGELNELLNLQPELQHVSGSTGGQTAMNRVCRSIRRSSWLGVLLFCVVVARAGTGDNTFQLGKGCV